jgi:diacylglycerol kinase family enzyme
MKRALLMFNPEATNVSARVRDVIARALSAEIELEVAETKRRDHARHLAAGAAHEGFDLVVCLAGDGTLNEIINGLAGTDVAIAPLPGGGTNVFARTLGLPRDPVEATAVLIERLREGAAPTSINLGRVNGRAFAFCAGVGFDAAVVRAVERVARLRKKMGDWLFVTTALRVFFFAYDRTIAPLTLRAEGQEVSGLRLAVVCNSDPFTFLASRPFRLCPRASSERGLDLTALRTMSTLPVLRVVWRAFGSGGHTRLRAVHDLHDSAGFELESDRPLPLQVDGDFVGEDVRFVFESEPEALRVLA